MQKKIQSLSIENKKDLYEYLGGFISLHKKQLFEENILNRTRYLTVVLEDIYQAHNASAVLRSCDCFGVQDVHIIENQNTYTINPDVALGSNKWLNLYKYNHNEQNTAECINKLKKAGYKIIATSPLNKSYTPDNLPLTAKTALIFGTELQGLTKIAMRMADDFVAIPMYGFTESFNISVSAALFLYTLVNRLRNENINWLLNEDEILDIKLQWTLQVLKKPEHIVNQYFSKNKK